MLRGCVDPHALLPPQPDAFAAVAAARDDGWRDEARALLAGAWRDQIIAAAAIALARSEDPPDAALVDALWRALDGISWVAPQLVAAAFVRDDAFARRAADRLLGAGRVPPKTIGALVRALHRLPSPPLPLMAQLARHDRTMQSEEARIGVRGVDAWLDYLGARAA